MQIVTAHRPFDVPAAVRRGFLVALLVAAGCASSAARVPAQSPAPPRSAEASPAGKFYMLARLDIRDVPRFQTEYAASVLPMLLRAGARVLVASPAVELREGTWDANWTVVLEFASRAAAMSFYESAEYQPLKQLRLSLLRSGSLLFVAGFPEGAK